MISSCTARFTRNLPGILPPESVARKRTPHATRVCSTRTRSFTLARGPEALSSPSPKRGHVIGLKTASCKLVQSCRAPGDLEVPAILPQKRRDWVLARNLHDKKRFGANQVSCARALSRAARASPNGTDITADTLALILRGAQFAISDVEVERLCRTCPGSTANTVDHREFVRWLDTAPSLATGRPTADRLEDTLTTASPWQARHVQYRAWNLEDGPDMSCGTSVAPESAQEQAASDTSMIQRLQTRLYQQSKRTHLMYRRMNPGGAECISPSDFARGITSLNMHLEADTARRMFAAVDANCDGRLSYQEFATAFEAPQESLVGSSQASASTATPAQAYSVSNEEAANARRGTVARALQQKLQTSEESAHRLLRRCAKGPHGGRPGIRRLLAALNMLTPDAVPTERDMALLLCAFDPARGGTLTGSQFLRRLLADSELHTRWHESLDHRDGMTLAATRDHLPMQAGACEAQALATASKTTTSADRSEDTRPVTSPAKLQSCGCALQPTLASVCDAMSSRPARFTRRAHTPAPSDTWRNMVPPAAVSAHAQNAEVFARKWELDGTQAAQRYDEALRARNLAAKRARHRRTDEFVTHVVRARDEARTQREACNLKRIATTTRRYHERAHLEERLRAHCQHGAMTMFSVGSTTGK